MYEKEHFSAEISKQFQVKTKQVLINDLEYLQTTMNWQFFAEGEMHIVE